MPSGPAQCMAELALAFLREEPVPPLCAHAAFARLSGSSHGTESLLVCLSFRSSFGLLQG